MKKILIVGVCLGIVIDALLAVTCGVVGVTYADSGLGEEIGVEEVDNSEGVEVVDEDNEVGDDSSDGAGDAEGVEDEGGEDETMQEDAKTPALYIKAVNPGYKIDGVNNVGEMIEIARVKNSDAPILLAGTAVGYTNSSGNYTILYEFPENSWMAGESILLRLASSPGSELAAVNYSKTLAMNAGITLSVDGAVMDEVCWTGKGECYKAFSSSKPTTLVRDLETGEFEHVFMYEPVYDEKAYYVEQSEEVAKDEEKKVSRCKGLQFSEILSYYEASKAEQFVEFYNAGSERMELDGCKLRYKNKKYVLEGGLEAEGYKAYYPTAFSLTKNPVSSNKLELIDADETVLDTMEYPNGQRKGTAYAFLGHDSGGGEIWKTTYAPTPGAPNNYQEFKTCEAGKVINKATGNCVKVTSVSEKLCKEGYYLNVLTGRCKKNTTKAEKTCKEGYYLNPETNRCRKIKENKGADYGLEPESQPEEASFVALYAVLGVVGVGAIYMGYEFRHEIAKLWRKVCRRSR